MSYFYKISDHSDPLQFFNVREELKRLVPEPDPNIVKRLISYYGGTNFTIRFPWQSAPPPASYDLENVKFYARILTMLRDLGIFPPPYVQSQGGKGLLPNIGGSFEGPTLFTPSGNASRRTLFVPETEMEVKRNALSSEPGGLADAAEGLVPEIDSAGIPQIRAIITAWETSHDWDVDLAFPPDENKNGIELQSVIPDHIREREQDASERIVLSRADFGDMLDENLMTEDEIKQAESNFDDYRAPVSREEIRTSARWGDTIRRRLPFTRVSPEQKEQIIELLPPASQNADDDDSLDDSDWDARHSAVRYWWGNLGSRARTRFEFIQKIAMYLLIPVSLTSGLLLHRNYSTEVEDDLIRLFRALPDNNWFKQLELRTWIALIAITSRDENFVLLQRVLQGVLHFDQDVQVLWLIQKLLNDNESTRATNWFDIIKSDVAFRATNDTALTLITKSSAIMSGYEWCYVCKSNADLLQVVLSYTQSIPILVPTLELLKAVKRAQDEIAVEHLDISRVQTFAYLLKSFSDVLILNNNYFSVWSREMLRLYFASKFNEVFDKLAFDNILQELGTQPQRYPQNTRKVLSDFFYRFKNTADLEVVVFQTSLQALKYDEDIYKPLTNLLNEMKTYHNDQKLDALSYEVLNAHWEEHSAKVPYSSFVDCVTNVDIDLKMQVALFALLSATDAGVFSFMAGVAKDLSASDEDLPLALPSVGLFYNGEAKDFKNAITSSAQTSRTLLQMMIDSSDIERVLEEHIPFYRTLRYVLLKVEDGVGVLMDTVEKGQRMMNFIVLSSKSGGKSLALLPDDNSTDFNVQAYRKPLDQSTLGDVLPLRSWESQRFDISVGVASVVLIQSMGNGAFGTSILAGAVSFGKLLLAKFSALSFQNQVVVGTATAATVVYGPTKIVEKTRDVVEGVTGGLAGAAGLVLLGGGAILLMSLNGNKRQKLLV